MSNRELGGRYQIQEQIGGGGMAIVYRAVDTLLGRTVAIKMLRPQYAGDEEFVNRFRQEAQAAARLSHPNIVNLYDVGMTENEYYIVMEYVDGPTLKDLIVDRAPLPIQEAVQLTSQICEALEHAHEHHIIHRDIKPHNILLTKSGMVKVADFGIARAVTGTTIADRQATSVLGSVHYFSPEQARGGNTDVKSDIYSLGVVMYEMLTKQLPFSGDSPVSVALKHLREGFIEPRQINSSIPQSVENIILRCLVKSPDRRYQNMTAVKVDLEDALLHPNVAKFVMPDEALDETIAIPAVGGVRAIEETMMNEGIKEKKPRKKTWWKTLISWFIALVVVCLGGVAAYFVVMDLTQVPNLNLPNVVGKSEQTAIAALEQAGFSKNQIREERSSNTDKPKGIVYDQNPEGPTQVKQTRTIVLYVSSGAPQVTIPNLTGVLSDVAQQTLVNYGFQANNITIQQVQSSQIPVNEVVSTSPAAGTSVPTDAKIVLSVSEGVTTSVPNIVGMTYSDAVQALQNANLRVGQITPVQSTQPGETVVKTSPAIGTTVQQNSTVNLYISENTNGVSNSTNPFSDNSSGSGGLNGGATPTGNLPPNTQAQQVTIRVPDKQQKPIHVQIYITDARGSNQLVVDQQITEETSWTETLYLTPGSSGSVQVYENGQLRDSRSISY